MNRPPHLRHAALLIAAAALLTGCGGGAASTEQAAPKEPNSTPLSLYTHCGVENIRIKGHWWHASPPLYNEAKNGPPTGWGDPHQAGTLTMESPDRAVFEAKGQRVVFVPAPDDEPIRVCR